MTFNNKYLLAIIPIVIIGSILYYVSDIVTYVLLAWAISMIGAPIVVFLRKFMGKNAAALLTLSLFIGIFGLIIYIFIPPLTQQLENLNKVDRESVVDALAKPLQDWENWLVSKKFLISETDTSALQINNNPKETPLVVQVDSSIMGHGVSPVIQIYLPEEHSEQKPASNTNYVYFLDNIKNAIATYLNPANIQKALVSAFNALGDIILGLFSIFFISFFFLKEQGLFDKILVGMVPEKYESHTRQAVNETSVLLIRYFVGVMLQIIIIAVYLSIALHLIGVKNALLIAFIAAILNVIPYIGPIIGATVGVIITLTSHYELSFYDELMPLVFKVIAVFISMQLIDNIILQPNIFSKSVKAHPLEIFIVVLIGAKIGGIAGMIFAIPFYTAFRVVGKVFLSEFKVIQSLTKHL